MKIILTILCILSTLLIIINCSNKENSKQKTNQIIVGGLYASLNEDGTYVIMKVLALDDFAVHLRTYKNKFSEVPKDLDSSILSMGGIDDPEGFGIGHFPLAIEGFWKSEPVFLKKEPVREDELEGYKIYLDAMKEQ